MVITVHTAALGVRLAGVQVGQVLGHNKKRRFRTLKAQAMGLAAVLTLAAPVKAEGSWLDISPRIAKVLGVDSLVNPWYIKKGSRKTIKSVEFKGTIYESAEFSYTQNDETKRRRFLVDCRTASYKDSITERGYATKMTYITFDGDNLVNNGEFDGWVAYKYLCPKAENPWMVITENAGGDKYGINVATIRRMRDGRYKNAYFSVASKITKYLSPEILIMYVACNPRRVEFNSVYEATNNFPQSDELNPGSIGESIAKTICESMGHRSAK